MESVGLSCLPFIKTINEIAEKRGNNLLRPHGVTLSQLRLLLVLAECPGCAATLKELEQYFHVAQPTLAGIAVRLEEKKLVESRSVPEDHRVKQLRLTEKGMQVCAVSQGLLAEVEGWLTGALSREEQNELQALLQRVYNGIK